MEQAAILKNAQDIQRFKEKQSIFPSGTVSDGHVPLTHHRLTYLGIIHMSFRLFPPLAEFE